MTQETQVKGLPDIPEDMEIDPSYGTVINIAKPAPTQYDDRIKELEQPVKVTLKLPSSFIARMGRVAQDSSKTVDEWVTQTVIEAIDGKVGQAVIKTPSFAKGPKVTGYTGSVTRVDNAK